MDDELEDRVLYETYVSHMKFLSKFAFGVTSVNSLLLYTWKLLKLYLFRSEVLLCGLILFILVLYLEVVDLWSYGLLRRIQNSLGYSVRKQMKFKIHDKSKSLQHWEATKSASGAYALLGRRPCMEDRFVIEENVNGSGVSIFAIFDGHGGEFAADFAKDILMKNIYNKIVDATKLLNSKSEPESEIHLNLKKVSTDNAPSKKYDDNKTNNPNSNVDIQLKDNSKKSLSSHNDDSSRKQIKKSKEKIDVFTAKLNSLIRPIVEEQFGLNNESNNNKAPQTFEAKYYIENGKINFGKMITDEILLADYNLIEIAKKSANAAGTTALIAIIQNDKLIVANVGDSRGVMCDSKGNAIPLSFDHKPQQVRERKRIHDAGGFIAFRGVWRVAGILATSRALGDYPLKDKKLVIADPDILTFELNDHKPTFVILASDGLWDTFSNEDAVAFIKDYVHDPTYGAKLLALQSYLRGSVDNITVMVIVFKDGVYRFSAVSNNREV